MIDQVLEADLEALGRLKPDIERLTEEVIRKLPSEMPGGEAGSVPSLAAAQEMSNRTLPAAQHAFAERLAQFAETVELARSGFIASEGQLLASIQGVPYASRPMIVV